MALEIFTLAVPTPFAVGNVNVYLLEAEDLTLIDTGPITEAAEAALESQLDQYGFSVNQIKRILITHGHQDHFGLAGRLAARSGAQIYLPRHDQHLTSYPYATDFYAQALVQAGIPPEKVARMIEGFGAMRVLSQRLEQFHTVSGGDEISLGADSLTVLDTPGHTPGSVCYYLPSGQALFAGDTLLKSITPNPILDMDPLNQGQRFKSLIRYLQTLRQLLPMKAKTIFPGHREVITDYAKHYQSVLEFYRSRQRKIVGLLAQRPKSAYELSLELFPVGDDINCFLAVSETLANLDLLKHQNHIDSISKEGVEYFAPREFDGNGAASNES